MTTATVQPVGASQSPQAGPRVRRGGLFFFKLPQHCRAASGCLDAKHLELLGQVLDLFALVPNQLLDLVELRRL